MEKISTFYQAQFVSPAVANDCLAYIFREQFYVANEKAKELGGLIADFERISPFAVKAPAVRWRRLFNYFQTETPNAVDHRQGMLIFALYMNMRNFKTMVNFEFDLDPFKNDIVLERKRLFEACMNDIFDVSEFVNP